MSISTAGVPSPQAQTGIPGRTAWLKPEPDADGSAAGGTGRFREMPGDTATRGHRRPVPAPGQSLLPPALLRQFRQFSQQVVALRGTGCPRNSPRRFQSVSAPGGETLFMCRILRVPPPSSNAHAQRQQTQRQRDRRHVAGCAADGPAGENLLLRGQNHQPRR